jgi:ABC-type nickel/cobalt efflux system permease component RcnA
MRKLITLLAAATLTAAPFAMAATTNSNDVLQQIQPAGGGTGTGTEQPTTVADNSSAASMPESTTPTMADSTTPTAADQAVGADNPAPMKHKKHKKHHKHHYTTHHKHHHKATPSAAPSDMSATPAAQAPGQ